MHWSAWAFVGCLVIAGALNALPSVLARRKLVNPDQKHAEPRLAPGELRVLRKRVVYDAAAGYKSKIYIEMLNSSGRCVELRPSRWVGGSIDAELFREVLQLWLGNKWYPVPDGVERLQVPPGESFRLWICPPQGYAEENLRRLCRANLGTLMLRVDGSEYAIMV